MYKEISQEVFKIIETDAEASKKLQQICDVLRSKVSYYHWVGFYFSNTSKQELHLAQFSGKPTEHTVIPFGKGICGQVAVSNKNFVVQDVDEQDNYISCGIEVKSEIVVPIFKNGENIGQIDIDSHDKNPFKKEDEVLLESICEKIAEIL